MSIRFIEDKQDAVTALADEVSGLLIKLYRKPNVNPDLFSRITRVLAQILRTRGEQKIRALKTARMLIQSTL